MNYSRYKPRGWRGDSHRHYLAAKGISTKHKYFKKLAESDKVTLWHGTSRKNADKILKEGLSPSTGQNPLFRADEGGFIHLATNRSIALLHAGVGSQRGRINDEPVLLKVTVPKDLLEVSSVKPLPDEKIVKKIKIDYLKSTFPGFEEKLSERQQKELINSVELTDPAVGEFSAFHPEYRAELNEGGHEFLSQYEILSKNKIPAKYIVEKDVSIERLTALRRHKGENMVPLREFGEIDE